MSKIGDNVGYQMSKTVQLLEARPERFRGLRPLLPTMGGILILILPTMKTGWGLRANNTPPPFQILNPLLPNVTETTE